MVWPLNTGALRAVCLSALLGAIALTAAPARGTLVTLDPLKYSQTLDLGAKVVQGFYGDLQEIKNANLGSNLDELSVCQQLFQKVASSLVPSRGFTYASEGYRVGTILGGLKAEPRTFSGRIFLPPRNKKAKSPTPVPLVVYQHDAETRRKATPYYRMGDETLAGALAAAAFGFAVAMPDGDGMGVDAGHQHAYCCAQAGATCIIDLIRAVRSQGKGDRIFDDQDYTWDGRIFIMGYGEGGFMAMAAVQELSTHPDLYDFNLTGAACMGGPFDLFDEMSSRLGKVNRSKGNPRPDLFAYLLYSWSVRYPNEFPVDKIFCQDLMDTKKASLMDPGNLKDWFAKGDLGPDELLKRIRYRLTKKTEGDVPPRALMNDAWAGNLDNPDSKVAGRLKENDLRLAKPWFPCANVLMTRTGTNRMVSDDCSANMQDMWQQQGYQNPIEILDLRDVNLNGGFTGGLFEAIPSAFIWIKTGMPRNWSELTDNLLSELVKAFTPDGLPGPTDLLGDLQSDRDADAAPFLLSRLTTGKYRYVVSLDPKWFKAGKVKFYELVKNPQYFDNQKPLDPDMKPSNQKTFMDTKLYLKVSGQIKKANDYFYLDKNKTYYFAIYPGYLKVNLQLRFTGEADSKVKDYLLNISQSFKTKAKPSVSASFTYDGRFKPMITEGAFENVKNKAPFLSLP